MANRKPARINAVSPSTEALFYVVIGLFVICCIIPFIYVVIISFSSEDSIRQVGYSFMPVEWSTEAYIYTFTSLPHVWRSFFNSVFITVVGTVLATAMCALYAYALYRPDFRFHRFFNFLSFFTMIFGGGLIPTYLVTKQLLGLSESYGALIVPLLVSPCNILIMRTFYKSSVSMELVEAAAIDGSGEYSTLIRIIFPVVKPGLACIALLNAMTYWNDWFQSLLYIKQEKVLQPLQALLMELQNNVDYLARMTGMMCTAAINEMKLPTQSLRMVLVVLIVVPIACAYPFFQRYIVSGLTIGSLKE